MSLAATAIQTLARALDVEPFLKAKAQRQYPQWMQQVAAQSQETDYGLHANQSKAYMLSAWVHICVSRIGETMAGVPYGVYELQEEEKIAVVNHPLEQLLKRPNYKWTGYEMKEATTIYVELTGNCYWFLSPESGWPLEAWLLRPDRMKIVPDRNEWIKGYVYTVNGVDCPLSPEEVVHFKRFHPLHDYVGLSTIEAEALGIELENKALLWDISFFRESAVPSAVVDVGKISDGDYEDVKKQWNKKYKGSANAHKTAFVRGGDTKVSTISVSHKDMQLLELLGFTREMIFNAHGVPLGLFSENATEANALVAERTFMNRTIHPKLQRMGEKISTEILSRFGDNLVGEFEDVRIGESKELWLREIEAVSKGTVGAIGMPEPLMSRDEIRERYFDMQPMKAVTIAAENAQKARVLQAAGVPINVAPLETKAKALEEDLRRWRDVSLRLSRSGRNPAEREFKSAIIPERVRERITEALWLAQGAEEVKAVFADPFGEGPADPAAEEKWAWEQRLIQGLLGMWRQHATQVLEWLGKHKDVKKQIKAREDGFFLEVPILVEIVIERQFAKALGEDLTNNGALWEGFEQDYTQLLLPAFEEVMTEAAQTAIAGLPFQIGIDWTLVNTAAAEWARDYTYELVSGLNGTTQKRLQAALGNWVEAGETFPDLVARVEKIFNNPVRAEMIAATEITRVYAEANTLAWRESGVVKGRRWETANDARVCPICAPLGGLTVTEGEAQPASIVTQRRRAIVADIDEPFIHPETGEEYRNPPAHVGCRCGVAPVV